ncbi:hypothetical protein BK708_21355 [Bacillus thuringiensis serovar yunnanensis]|nr:hypothetical protein BK708_21355 [Bacillus thuringiensis serovar yunnanensis]
MGETLALVSIPIYDPKNSMLNRFTQVVVPGSVFKAITGKICLEKNVINPKEEFRIEGLKYTKDASWGNYYVIRVHEASLIDFDRAIKYSDNIYFSQQALKIGKDRYISEAKKFGFSEKLPIEYEFRVSKLMNKDIKDDIQLVDTGYGQGEVVMTPLHVLLAYALIVNDGNIPSLIKDHNQAKPWKENVISKGTQEILKSALKNVINDADGIGSKAKIDGITLGGKTGTAELKKTKGENGKELGWFMGFNLNSPNMIVTMMIEDVQGRGGSSITAQKVKNIFHKSIKRQLYISTIVVLLNLKDFKMTV